MTKILSILCFVVAVHTVHSAPLPAARQRAQVDADNVIVRAKATTESEHLGVLQYGQEIRVKELHGEWAEIYVPTGLGVWVHRDFIDHDRVTASELNIRAGAGINYSVVGSLKRGDVIERRGEFGDWYEIKAPDECSLWVHASLVKLAEPEKPKMQVAVKRPKTSSVERAPPRIKPPEPAAPAQRAAETEGVASKTKPAVETLKLVPLKGQGTVVQREGELKRVGFVFGRPSKYRLVQARQNSYSTICYVRGNDAQLSEFVNKRLLVKGKEYWVQGVRHPVVIPDQLVPVIGERSAVGTSFRSKKF